MDASEGGDDGERREEWGTNEPLESSWLVPREKQLWAKDSYGGCLARRRSHRIQQGRISFIFTCVSMTAYVVMWRLFVIYMDPAHDCRPIYIRLLRKWLCG